MRQRYVLAVLSAVIALSSLVGCGRNSGQGAGAGAAPVVGQPAPAAVPAAKSGSGTPEQSTVTQLILARKNDEAVKVAAEAAQQRPKDAEAHFLLGLSLYTKGDLDGAIQSYEKAVALDKNHLMALNNLGNAFRDKGNFTAAEQWYRKAMAVNPQFAVTVEQLALMLEGIGKVPEAIKVLEEGIKRIPTSADLLVAAGMMYEENAEKEKAREAYTKALQLASNLLIAKQRLQALGK